MKFWACEKVDVVKFEVQSKLNDGIGLVSTWERVLLKRRSYVNVGGEGSGKIDCITVGYLEIRRCSNPPGVILGCEVGR